MSTSLCKNVHKTIRLTTPKDEHKKPGDEKICHELTDTRKKITRPKTARSDLEKTSLNGTHSESNLEMCPKCRKSKALVETIKSGIFDTNDTKQTHQ
jgi:hypothetical protein